MQRTIRLLGAVDIQLDGTPAPASLHRPRKVALLAYLLLTPGPARRSHLAALLWPEVDDRRARGSLNQMMVELRRELGADAFEARTDDELAIAPGAVTCDALELLQAAREGRHDDVLATYNADLLAGFTVPGAASFNEWLDRARASIADTVADSALKVSASANAAECDRALRVAALIRPYDEAILRRRMTVASQMGGAAAAATLYETHRMRIGEELGISPSPETRKHLFAITAATAEVAEERSTPERSASPQQHRSPTAARSPRRFALAAVAACMLFAAALFAAHAVTSNTAAKHPRVDVALMSFGDDSQPVIRALPGLVATYLIRDSSIDVRYGEAAPGAFEVLARLNTENDEISGTIQIRSRGAIVASTALRTSTRAGMDTIAAQLARYVTDVVRPTESYATPALALSAARQHLLYARADYARGVRQNAAVELEKAILQLDTIPSARRNTEWSAVREAVTQEREMQARGE